MLKTIRSVFVVSFMLLLSGSVRGDATHPRLLRSNNNGENLGVIQGLERESILKEFRFEKSSSSRLSTREDAWQHEDGPLPSRDYISIDESEDEEENLGNEVNSNGNLHHRAKTMNDKEVAGVRHNTSPFE